MNPLMIAALAKGGGDLIGGVTSYFGNKAKADAARKAINTQVQGEEEALGQGNAYYDNLVGEYGKDAESYLSDLAGWRKAQTDAMPEYQEQSADVDVNKFMDPAVAYRQKQAADAINQSAMAKAGLFSGSGSTAKALQDRASQIASDEWGKAFERGTNARDFGANQYLNKFKSLTDNELSRRQGLENLLKQSGGARQSMFDAQGAKTDLGMSTTRSIADLRAGKDRVAGDLAGSTWDSVGGAFKSIGDGASSYFGSKGNDAQLQALLAKLKGGQ